MPAPDLESFKVANGELSSATKFNNLVQALEDELADIDADQIPGFPNDATKFLRGDGAWAVAGGSSLHVFTPLHNEPPAANFATLDTRNGHPVLDFDAATDESAVFRGVLNRSYAGLGIVVKLIWAATSATSGTCRWGAQIERIAAGAQDLDADSFATADTAGGTADATNGETTETEITLSSGAEMDSLVAGEMFRLKVFRDADGTSGTDDMTGDAELVAVEIRNA